LWFLNIEQVPKVNKRRALIVPYPYCPPTNGGQHVAYAFSEFISKKDKLYCLSTTNNQLKNLPFALIPFFKDSKSKYFNPIYAFRLYRFLKQNKIEECILFQPFAFLLILPTLFFSSTKISIYVQNMEYKRFQSIGKPWWRLMFWWEKISYRLSWKLYFVTTTEIEDACKVFNVPKEKCIPAVAGTRHQSQPKADKKAIQNIRKQHPQQKLLLFYGSRHYYPNLKAVKDIIDHLIPAVKKQTNNPFIILIAGLGEAYKTHHPDVRYLGFVPVIQDYIQAADLILNPITLGAGIQTKVLEAISYGATVVATRHAANGIDTDYCEKKLIVVPNHDYREWSRQIVLNWNEKPATPEAFYLAYYWGKTLGDV